MKRIAAVFFFFIFLFNLFGYRAWYYFAQLKADAQITEALDSDNYNEADLITINVPISLPYQTNWSDFERIDGEITLNGQVYRYVKRKIYNGELILLCLPYRKKMNIQTAKDSYARLAYDMDQVSSSKKSNNINPVLKFVFGPFDKNEKGDSAYIDSTRLKQYITHNILLTISFPHLLPDQPPEFNNI